MIGRDESDGLLTKHKFPYITIGSVDGVLKEVSYVDGCEVRICHLLNTMGDKSLHIASTESSGTSNTNAQPAEFCTDIRGIYLDTRSLVLT